jgi:hypothetical protein
MASDVRLDRVTCYGPGNNVPPGTNMNLACGVVENLDYSGVKAATGNFNMTIITLGITQGCYHSILSRRSARPKALSMPCGWHADSGTPGILVGTCPIEVWSSKHLGPKCQVGLRQVSTCHMVNPDPWGCRSWTRGQDWHMACLGAHAHRQPKPRLNTRAYVGPVPLLRQVRCRWLVLIPRVPNSVVPTKTLSGITSWWMVLLMMLSSLETPLRKA